MNQTIQKAVVAALGAVALLSAACDPWSSEDKSQPQVLRVLAVEASLIRTGASANKEATNTSGTWVITDPYQPVDPTPDDPTPAPIQMNLIQIQANKLLDGASIQTASNDCTPAAGGLTVTSNPGPAAGLKWYTCYNPSSPNIDQGGSIFVFQAADPGGDADPLTAEELAAGTVVTISGQVKDHQGSALPVNVSVTY